MGLATQPPSQPLSCRKKPILRRPNSTTNSMSQGFHQGIFSFSDGFDRPTSTTTTTTSQEQQHHIAQQSRRDKLRVQGFEPAGSSGHPLVPIDEPGEEPGSGIYEPVVVAGASNMLAEMFNFPTTPGPATSDLLANQIPGGYGRVPPRPVGPFSGFAGDWYRHQHDATVLNADSAAAMQLFLMNPPQHPQAHPRSPSPPALQHHHHQAFQAAASFPEASFSGGVVENQGLSLSLSSSLQQFEMAKAEELRVRDGVLYFSNTNNNNNHQQQQQQQSSSLHLQGHHGQQSQGHGQLHMGYGPMGVMNMLRNSKYSRAAQELLEEFCSVGRGPLKGSRIGRHHGSSSTPKPNPSSVGVAGPSSSSSSKDVPPLTPADRFEHQRKKSKLLSMLDEVDRRYNHYCDQMQMVVNSFDSVMGFGAATPYTALAQKAMSRHFRCLKDAIVAQLKITCEALGEKEGGSGSGITKGETPRLRLLDQSLRQQRAFHQMGMMEQEAWRPQRGLPERSVSLLRAWLFEHFLHPYPSDADKHLLARQTGLSRNQVSNWFINARVRLWKPMVEEMYQQESKDETEDRQTEEGSSSHQTHRAAQSSTLQQAAGQKPETDAPESDPTTAPISSKHHRFPSENQSHLAHQSGTSSEDPTINIPVIDPQDICGPNDDLYGRYGPTIATTTLGPAGLMRFGTAGDVSLTLGLRHAGNAPEKNRFTVRDFGGC